MYVPIQPGCNSNERTEYYQEAFLTSSANTFTAINDWLITTNYTGNDSKINQILNTEGMPSGFETFKPYGLTVL